MFKGQCYLEQQGVHHVHVLQRLVMPQGLAACFAGAFLPFTSREDMDFFSHLEMHLRQEHPPLSGRDHMSYRSSYFPVKDVIDGDLCEQYTQVVLWLSLLLTFAWGVCSVKGMF